MKFSNCHIKWKDKEKCSFMPNVKLDGFTLPFQQDSPIDLGVNEHEYIFFALDTFICVKWLTNDSF